MNKTELIAEVAEAAETTKVNAEKVLNSFFNVVGRTLSEGKDDGEKVQIMGFGTFKTSFVEGRIGVNPQNRDEEIEIPDGYRIHFSAGQQLKDLVNDKVKKAKKAKKSAKVEASKKSKAKSKKGKK